MLDKIYEEEKEENKATRVIERNAEMATLFLLVMIFMGSAYVVCDQLVENDYEGLNHFSRIYFDESEIESVNNIDQYILNYDHDIYMLDAYAARHLIPIDKYDKNFGLFLKGNIGSKGEDGLIEQIKNNDKEARYLISKDENRNWQTHEKVIVYVIDNFEKVDEIEGFDVYQMKY